MISLEQIAKAVRDGKQERERAIRTLAGDKGLQAKVKAMVLAKGGTKEDALTVYSDTIVAFVKRIIKEPALTISVPCLPILWEWLATNGTTYCKLKGVSST